MGIEDWFMFLLHPHPSGLGSHRLPVAQPENPAPPSMTERDPRLTQLLAMGDLGNPLLREELLERTYEELRAMASMRVRSERAGGTLHATALVHEAYINLVRGDPNWENRAHFFGAAAEAMRRILVDRARKRLAAKRGGDAVRTTLGDLVEGASEPNLDVLALHEALDGLAEESERLAEVVKLRFFVGLSVSETADALNISAITVKRDWRFARAWLLERMKP